MSDEETTQGEGDPAAPTASAAAPAQADTTAVALEELNALRAENQRLAGELSARYAIPQQQIDPAASRGLAPAPVDDTPIRELAEELGVKPEKLKAVLDSATARAEQATLSRVDQAMRAQQVAQQVATAFFSRFPKLDKHRATVDQVVRAFTADPVRMRGRNVFQEDVLIEVAQESHRALQLEYLDAKAAPSGGNGNAGGTVVVAAGDVRQAQVAPGRSGGGGGAPAKPEPETHPVDEWNSGIAAAQERGVSGSRLAGVQTR